MATQAFSGVGAQFRKYNGTAWVKIAEVKTISGPTMSREMIDVTSLDSTGGYREFIPSFRDGGTVTLNMLYTRAGYEALKDDFQSTDLIEYEVVLPDSENTTINFSGYVQELPINVTFDDAVTADTTIKVTGEVNINSGSGS